MSNLSSVFRAHTPLHQNKSQPSLRARTRSSPEHPVSYPVFSSSVILISLVATHVILMRLQVPRGQAPDISGLPPYPWHLAQGLTDNILRLIKCLLDEHPLSLLTFSLSYCLCNISNNSLHSSVAYQTPLWGSGPSSRGKDNAII